MMGSRDKPKSLLIPIITCIIASCFYIYDYILRVMPQAMAFQLMQDLKIDAGDLGVLSSLFFWGYAPMQIPCGMLFDRFSARKILTIGILLASLATLGFAHTSHFVLASFYRFIMGFTGSFAFVGALVVGANWFRGQHFALYTGLVQFLGCMGAIIGISPLAAITLRFGWQNATQGLAILGLILAAIMWLIVRDAPKVAIPETYSSSSPKTYHKAFHNPQTWYVALYGFAIWGPITIFANLWGVPFLEEAYGFNKILASNHISTIWLTIAFGGLLVGWISKHFKTRRIPMFFCSIVGIPASIGILFLPHLPHYILNILLIAFGVSTSGLVIVFGLVADIQPPKSIGMVIGFTNMAVILGGLILLPAAGFIMRYLWDVFGEEEE